MVCPVYAQSLGKSTVGANKSSKMGALGPSPDNLRGFFIYRSRVDDKCFHHLSGFCLGSECSSGSEFREVASFGMRVRGLSCEVDEVARRPFRNTPFWLSSGNLAAGLLHASDAIISKLAKDREAQ